MSFRDNLQHLRATHAMTQEQLAMMVGVSRQSVTKWEAERAFSISLVAGLLLLFVGVVAASLSDGHGALAEGIASTALVALLAAGAWLIVRASILLSRVNVASYNEACEQAATGSAAREAR